MSKPRIAIADDHPEVLNRVAKFLADKFEIVALASGGAAAVNAVLASKPLPRDWIIGECALPKFN